jgi:GTPase SAR1 family protein
MSNISSFKSILLLAANPKTTTNLRLQEEEREIRERLRLSGYGKVPINSAVAVRPRDIQQALLDFKPQIVHFSGHGANQQGLVFEDNVGKVTLIESEALTQLFELFSSRVECVVLNACYSVIQAQAIAKYVNYVVGMNEAIGDSAAIEFSVGFYAALGAGETYEFAYKIGCNAIQLAGIQEHLTPKLLKKESLSSEENSQTLVQTELNELDSDQNCIETTYPSENPVSFDEPCKDTLKNSNYENYPVHKRKLARPAFDVGTRGEIRVIGPRNSGKTTFLSALADWHDPGFRKPLKAIEPINEDSLSLKRCAEYLLRHGERLKATHLRDEDPFCLPHYLFRLEITPNFWHNPLCWLFKRNVRFSLSCRDFAGEFINALKSPSEHFFIDSFLDDCAFSSGLLVMIDATDSLQLDKEYSQAFSTLRRELTSRIRRGGWKVKYKIAVVFSKADQYKIWKYRKRLKEFISINFPCTQRVFQEWSKDGYCVVSYFACSAFGMRGNPPQPNVIDDVSNGNCGYLADPTVWQPFGLASAIYWLSTGKVDARLQ